jgi:hypothetical protein
MIAYKFCADYAYSNNFPLPPDYSGSSKIWIILNIRTRWKEATREIDTENNAEIDFLENGFRNVKYTEKLQYPYMIYYR